MDSEQLDWTVIEDSVIQRIIDEGQTFLDNQIRLAVAADQRSAAMATVFITASAGLTAGVITVLGTSTIANPHPIVVAGAVSAIMFFASAGLCIWSTWPVRVWLPGNSPSAWFGDIKARRALHDSLAAEVEIIQDKILENDQAMHRNVLLYTLGSGLGLFSPLAGALIWAIIKYSLRY